MNRLQKRCLIGTASTHVLLILILVFGSAFFRSTPKSKTDELPVLTVIPTTLTDQPFNSGVPKPVTPPPTTRPPPPTPPTPIQPPTPPPPPKLEKQVEKPQPEDQPVELSKGDLTPVKPTKFKKPEDKPENLLTHPVKHHLIKQQPKDTTAQDEARERHEAQQRARDIARVARDIEKNASSSTEVQMPGNSSVSYANYAQAVRSKYYEAWSPPDSASTEEANIHVKVVISADGNVVSAHIIEASGDASLDASVRRALERVSFIGPFPEGATESERTFLFYYNIKSKMQNG